MLTPGRYLVLPVSLRPAAFDAAISRDYVVRVGSAKPLLCGAVHMNAREVATAVGQHIKKHGTRRHAFDGQALFTLQDGCGWLFFAENNSRMSREPATVDCNSRL